MKHIHAFLCAVVLAVAVSDQPVPTPTSSGIRGSDIVNLYASDVPFDPRRPWPVYDVPKDKWFHVTDVTLEALYGTKRKQEPNKTLPMDLLSKEGRRTHIMRSRWFEGPWHSAVGFAFPPGSQVCFRVPVPGRHMVECRIGYEITGHLTAQ